MFWRSLLAGCYRVSTLTMENEEENNKVHVQEHLKHAFSVMDSLRKKKELCDVVLKVGHRQIHAHRLVLASCSPYFYAMFTHDVAESRQHTVTLKDIDPNSVDTLVNFAYTADVFVTESNVLTLLPAACILQFNSVRNACCSFLQAQLDPTNCLGILQFSDLHGCQELHTSARNYCIRHFCKVARHEEFLTLPFDRLSMYLDDEHLCAKCEDEVLLALLRWVKHDLKKRKSSLYELLQCIRLLSLSPKFLVSLIDSDIIARDVNSKTLLSNALKDIQENCALAVKKRRPLGPPVIYIAGGYLKHSLCTVECFDPESTEWTTLSPMTLPRSGVGAAFVDCMLYIIGGRNNSIHGNIDSSAVDRYDPSTNLWAPVAPLNVPRNRVGVVVVEGSIYAVGGNDGNLHLNSVEKYNAEEDKWEMVTPMNTRRIGVGVAVMGRCLYAVGGYDGDTRLRSVECFNVDEGSWKYVCPTNVARSGAGVAAVGAFIYVAGGYDGITQLNSAERYCPRSDTWTLICPMICQRSALSMAEVDGCLWALGGYDGKKFLESLEVYNEEEDRWLVGTSMSVGRSGAGVTVGPRPSF